MKPLTLMIKPASGLCQLACDYCFYRDLRTHQTVPAKQMMSKSRMERIVQLAYEAMPSHVTFIFQGGEPLLAGLDFYQAFIQAIERFNVRHIPTEITLQTNGTLLNADWAKFFAKHAVLIGISIDGPENLHDYHRVNDQGEGTFKDVLTGLALLKTYQVDYTVLSVVTNETVPHTEKVYHFLKTLGGLQIQFIPCLDPLKNDDHDTYLTAAAYETFLIQLFNVWEADFWQGNRIGIRFFDDLIRVMIGLAPSTCTMMGQCVLQYVVEADGPIYPCDFYATEAYVLGHIEETDFLTLTTHPKAQQFISESLKRDPACQHCAVKAWCYGGCRREWTSQDDASHFKTRYCHTFQHVFSHILPRLKPIAEACLKG